MRKDHKLEDYLYTLDICLRSLPEDAPPDHYTRIKEIKEILVAVLKDRK